MHRPRRGPATMVIGQLVDSHLGRHRDRRRPGRRDRRSPPRRGRGVGALCRARPAPSAQRAAGLARRRQRPGWPGWPAATGPSGCTRSSTGAGSTSSARSESGSAERRCSTRHCSSGPSGMTVDAVPGMPHPTGGWPVGFDALSALLRGCRGTAGGLRRAGPAVIRGGARVAAAAVALARRGRGRRGAAPERPAPLPQARRRALPAGVHRVLRTHVSAALQDGRPVRGRRAGAEDRPRGGDRPLRGGGAARNPAARSARSRRRAAGRRCA